MAKKIKNKISKRDKRVIVTKSSFSKTSNKQLKSRVKDRRDRKVLTFDVDESGFPFEYINSVITMDTEYFDIPLPYGKGINIYKIEFNRPIGRSRLEYICSDYFASTATYQLFSSRHITKESTYIEFLSPVSASIRVDSKFHLKGFKKGDIVKITISTLKYNGNK